MRYIMAIENESTEYFYDRECGIIMRVRKGDRFTADLEKVILNLDSGEGFDSKNYEGALVRPLTPAESRRADKVWREANEFRQKAYFKVLHDD